MKAQDLAFVFASIASNPRGLPLVFSFLESKMQDILKKFGSTSNDGTFFFPVQVLLSRTFSKFSDTQKIEQINEIFSKNNLYVAYQRTYDQIVESIEISEKFLELNKDIAIEVLGTIVPPQKEEL